VSRVFLVHWHQGEARERAGKLEAMGHEVVVHCSRTDGSDSSGPKAIAAEPPDAVIVDLSRLPSHGMAIATWLRGRKGTRAIPLVFVPGEPAKTAKARDAFPDAAFAPWPRLRATLAKAIARPVRDPVVPAPAGYSGTPLPKKLGIKPRTTVLLVGAPRGWEPTLGELPDDVVIRRGAIAKADMILWFVNSTKELRAGARKAARVFTGGLWIAWPKKASGVPTDLSEDVVRTTGIAAGLVDFKVCAIDATWSGHRFARSARGSA
jgi:hypothetical protein